MQKFVTAILFSVALSSAAAQAEITWSGVAGVRHMIRKMDDGLNTKTQVGSEFKDSSKSTQRRWEFKGVIGASNKGESVDWGIDLRTYANQRSEWLSVSNGQDLAITIGQAYGRYHTSVFETDMGLTFGRAKTVLLYDNVSQQLFDNDARWDGFGWTFKRGMFGVNAVQYVLGAANQGTAGASTYSKTEATEADPQAQSHFGVLYALQPYVQFKPSDTITSTFALGWLNWSGTGAKTGATSTSGFYSNDIHGGTKGTVGNTSPVIMDNAQQWQLLSDTSLPYNLRLVGEYVRNKKTFYGTRIAVANPAVEADRNAWAATLYWGKPKKAGDYGLGYTYGSKGIASVVGTFTNGDVPVDNNSHFLEGRYLYADNLFLLVKAQFHTEKALLDGNGQPLAAPNNTRKQSEDRFEFITQAQF